MRELILNALLMMEPYLPYTFLGGVAALTLGITGITRARNAAAQED